MIIEEFEHNLELDPSEGLKRFEDDYAMSERIMEWLETPEGTVADNPGWGHNLSAFKHEPPGATLEVMIEMDLVEKITRDIKDLKIVAILVEPMDIDLYKLIIEHSLGTVETEVSI